MGLSAKALDGLASKSSLTVLFPLHFTLIKYSMCLTVSVGSSHLMWERGNWTAIWTKTGLRGNLQKSLVIDRKYKIAKEIWVCVDIKYRHFLFYNNRSSSHTCVKAIWGGPGVPLVKVYSAPFTLMVVILKPMIKYLTLNLYHPVQQKLTDKASNVGVLLTEQLKGIWCIEFSG